MKPSVIALSVLISTGATAESIIVQSTTSTKNSGLYDYLLTLIQRDLGLTVNVVAVGTGQAIKNAMRCDGDVLLVHAKAAEEKFVSEGYGLERHNLMYNDFVIIGPAGDPAGLANAADAADALNRIQASGAKFASRGDDSGTHKKEQALWRAAGIDPLPGSGDWYLETGSGMGATLNTGIGVGAYVMTDRATWLKFGNKQDAQIQFEGDAALFNQYGVIPVNPVTCPSVNKDGAIRFRDWLISDKGQAAIAAYQVDGKPLFFPNAN
ncbi:substrate-binding domain-containing protein [Litorivicinus lipolyticus]|uniref:substrate-binding domain-containing protein n=1 Tax=Litorivicinus lipolyticus TaxID=418701 RepID=UPI003B5C17F3